jgi:DNA primase
LSRYSQDIIEQVRTANDIVDIIGGVVELKSSGGGRMAGLCPFHQDSDPSFTVNRDEQRFFCFGCEAHGDVFGFVIQHEGLTFIEALRSLADRGRVHLPAPTEQEGREEMLRSRLLDLGKWAHSKFAEAINSPTLGKHAGEYLKTRSLNSATTEKFGVGFAPDGWRFLLDTPRKKEYDEDLLLKSGLVKRGDRGSCYDLFRNRLMFPIRNPSGDVIAFGGRDLSGDAPGKYINSPENAVYKKNQTLYGVYEAREAMRREKRAVLVEGYFDVLRCHEAGLQNTVATCGTALTMQQAKLLRRYVADVVILYDGDAAGLKAALKGVAILTASDLAVRAVALPSGQDPDDFVQNEGAQALKDLVDGAENFVSFYVRWSANRLETIEGRTEVSRELFGILRGISDEIRRSEYLKLVASELNLDPWMVRNEFDRGPDKDLNKPRTNDNEERPTPKLSRDDLNFVAALLRSPELADRARDGLKGVSIAQSPIAFVLKKILHGSQGDQLAGDDSAAALFDAAANLDPDQLKDTDTLVDRRIKRIKRDALETQRTRLQDALAAAARSEEPDDPAKATALLAEKISIEREIEAIGAV